MAHLLANNEIYAVRAWCTLVNQAAVNTYNYRVSAVSGATVTDQDVANGFDLLFSAFYPDILANGAFYNGAQVYRISPNFPELLPTKSTSNATAGGGGANAGPKGAAAIGAYQTLLRGPKYRGRIFLPFIASQIYDPNGELNAPAVTFINLYLSTLLLPTVITVGAGSATLDWVLLHRKDIPVDYDFISSAAAVPRISNLHKRGDYGRLNVSPI